MAQLTEEQIRGRDIDWYCLVNGEPTHIASMGGMIPEKFADTDKLRPLQNRVISIEPFTTAELRTENIQAQTSEGYEYLQEQGIRELVERVNANNPDFTYLRDYDLAVRLYAMTFASKARRGFKSYARITGAEGNEYVLIAEPRVLLDYREMNLELEALEVVVNGKNGGMSI